MRALNLPNKLTLLRILLVPFILLCFSLPPWGMWIAVVLFVIAAVTDTLDGRYARAHNMVTDFGKFMDPIADKLLVTSVLVLLTAQGKVPARARPRVTTGLRCAPDTGPAMSTPIITAKPQPRVMTTQPAPFALEWLREEAAQTPSPSSTSTSVPMNSKIYCCIV